MTRPAITEGQRYRVGVYIAMLLAFVSWFTISPGTPQVFAPLNLLVMLPAFFTQPILGDGYIIAATVFVPVIFWIWCLPVLGGRVTVPTRSLVLFIGAVILSAICLAFGYSYGVRYQSPAYAVGVITVNVVCWGILTLLAVLARRRPSYAANLGFHAALFMWLAWFAFPWLGELP